MKKTLRMLCAGVLLAAGGPAQADFYIAGGAYSASIDADTALQEDSDVTPALFLGWRPLEMFGVEVGYYDLGSYEIGPSTSFDASAITAAALLSMELGPVGAYAKGGLSATAIDNAGIDDDSTDPFAGLGLTIDLMDKLYVYVEALRFMHDGDNEADLDLVGAGLRYAF